MKFFLSKVSGLKKSSTRSKKAKIGIVRRSLSNKYKSRKLMKRRTRQDWILQLSAVCKKYGISYSRLVFLLSSNDIAIDRKILSLLINTERYSFNSILVKCLS